MSNGHKCAACLRPLGWSDWACGWDSSGSIVRIHKRCIGAFHFRQGVYRPRYVRQWGPEYRPIKKAAS